MQAMAVPAFGGTFIFSAFVPAGPGSENQVAAILESFKTSVLEAIKAAQRAVVPAAPVPTSEPENPTVREPEPSAAPVVEPEETKTTPEPEVEECTREPGEDDEPLEDNGAVPRMNIPPLPACSLNEFLALTNHMVETALGRRVVAAVRTCMNERNVTDLSPAERAYVAKIFRDYEAGKPLPPDVNAEFERRSRNAEATKRVSGPKRASA